MLSATFNLLQEKWSNDTQADWKYIWVCWFVSRVCPVFILHGADTYYNTVKQCPSTFGIWKLVWKGTSLSVLHVDHECHLSSSSAKGRPEVSGSVRRDSDVIHQGAGEGHREARGELQPELAAFLPAHQAARLHAWGTEIRYTKTEHLPWHKHYVISERWLTTCILQWINQFSTASDSSEFKVFKGFK